MPNLVMLVGIPGSGKSYLAEKLSAQKGYVIHSSDNLRVELFGDIDHQTDNRELFRVLENRIIDDLMAGKDVIYDATNLNRRRRMAFVERAKKRSGATVSCNFLNVPYELCQKRNRERARVVPEDVVLRMYRSIETPSIDEGYDVLWCIGDTGDVQFPKQKED